MSAKKVGGAIAALLVIVAVAAYFILVPGYEKEYAQQLKTYVESLPGNPKIGSIDVSFSSKKAEIKNFTNEYTDATGLRHEVAADSLVLVGVNLKALETPGVVDILDTFQATGVTIKSSGTDYAGQQMSMNITIESIEATKARGDAMGMQAISVAAQVDPSHLLDVLNTFSAASVTAKGYNVDAVTEAGPIQMRLASMAGKDMSLLAARDVEWKGMSFNLMNMDIMTLDSLRVAKMSIPKIDAAKIEEMEKKDADSAELLEYVLGNGPFTIEGMEFSDLNINPLKSEPVVLKKLRMDWYMSMDKLEIKGNADNLVVPASIYSLMSREMAQFAGNYGKPLDISSGVEISATQKNGRGDLSIKNLMVEDAALGSFKSAGEFSFASEENNLQDLLDNGGEMFLKNASFTMEDKLVIEELLKAASGGAANVQEMRTQAAAEIERDAARATKEEEKVFMEALAKLLREPGTLRVTVSPDSPVNVDHLGRSSSPSLRMKAEFTPASR